VANSLEVRWEMKEKVVRVVREYIQMKPSRITLLLYWEIKKSDIELQLRDRMVTITLPGIISFTSFAHGVIEVYEEVYGKLNIIPLSFREEIYRNDRVSLHLYPTGGAGRFDIFISYY